MGRMMTADGVRYMYRDCDDRILEAWAPNKTMLRKAACLPRGMKVVQVPEGF